MKLSGNKKVWNLDVKNLIVFLSVILFMVGCNTTNKAALQSPPESANSIELTQNRPVEKVVPVSEIDLSKIGRITPKGRVQDKDYNQLKVVDELIASGKESIPFLISKLDDKTKINGHVKDFWGEIHIGDVAFIILTNFFTTSDWQKTTIEGVGWNEFLGCTNPDIPAQNCFIDYVEKNGRKTIKSRWQKIWEENKEKIYWDEAERCFKVKAT